VSVSCARCGHDWPEGDPGVRYASGEPWCASEAECDDRMDERPITVIWRAAIAADPNPERLQGVHDGQ
jgi:hypothetical protein